VSGLYSKLAASLAEKENSGTRKYERVLASAQSTEVKVEGVDVPVVIFCTNDYLGLSNHPSVLRAARLALDVYGYGLSSVRFICGTQRIHKELEERLAGFFGMEDVLLFTSCYSANGGLFESVLGENDSLVSARLNHASIIDGARLCKARRFVYQEEDPADLDRVLREAGTGGDVVVVTDGVFSMEGSFAPLDKLVPICREHGALLAVDDSHATGVVGRRGRGTPEHFDVAVDIVTGTLGKALGGANGGFIAGKRDLIEWLRNTCRPYLFSNSLAPCLAAGAIAALDIVSSDEGAELRARLRANANRFGTLMEAEGFDIRDVEHPIIPVMLSDAGTTAKMADRLLELGVYVIGFSYPVVPKESPRIRVQLSAAHSAKQIDRAVEAFVTAGEEIGLLPRRSRGHAARVIRPLRRTMRAWVYHNNVQADGGHLSLENVPIPVPQPGELLVKISRVTVCGTDEDLFRGKFSEIEDGIIPGHEVFGEIVDWGSNVRGFHVGQKLVAESHYLLPGYPEEGVIGLWGPKVPRGGYLRPINGGYAEHMVLPTSCAHVVPETLDTPDFFPSLLEGAGNDCHIADYLLDRGLLGTVAVVGCGCHGLFTQMFCKHFGARKLAAFDIDTERIDYAKSFGADRIFNSLAHDIDTAVHEFTDGKGFDVVIDIAGGKRSVLEMCLDYVRDGGTLVLFGLYGDDSVKLDGFCVDEIVFSQRELETRHKKKRIDVKGITGREGIWEYLIDAVALSQELRENLMRPVTVMGPLENLGRDTLALDSKRILKRGYTTFSPLRGSPCTRLAFSAHL